MAETMLFFYKVNGRIRYKMASEFWPFIEQSEMFTFFNLAYIFKYKSKCYKKKIVFK